MIRLKSARTEGAEAGYWSHFRTEQGAKKCTGLWHFADRLNIVHVTATSAQAGALGSNWHHLSCAPFCNFGPSCGPRGPNTGAHDAFSLVFLTFWYR